MVRISMHSQSEPNAHALPLMCACAVLLRRVGLFTVLFAMGVVGARLLRRVLEARHSLCALASHSAAVAGTVAGWLLLSYLAWFTLHINALQRHSADLAQADSMLEAQWKTTLLTEQPALVAIGSRVTLKNNGGASEGGGFLHSHSDLFPAHPRHADAAQQVTVYQPDEDPNNEWKVWPAQMPPRLLDGDEVGGDGCRCSLCDCTPLSVVNASTATPCSAASVQPTSPFPRAQLLFHGSRFHLQHVSTGAFLAVRKVHAPLSRGGLEVSATADISDKGFNSGALWELQLVSAAYRASMPGSALNLDSRLHILTDRFALRNVQHSCMLRSGGVQLPDWAWSQKEVFCDRLQRTDAKAMWNVHAHAYDAPADEQLQMLTAQPALPFWHYSFLDAILELNRMMLQSNRGLVAAPDKPEDTPSSPPSWWPLLVQGIRMTQWNPEQLCVYMFGNVVVWWLGACCALVAPAAWALLSLSALRQQARLRGGVRLWSSSFTSLSPRWSALWFVWFGWAWHYLPMFLLGRVTYLHHYFPAALFLGPLIACTVDAAVTPHSNRRAHTASTSKGKDEHSARAS